MVLPELLNIVGSSCLLVRTSAILAQLALRLRADREGTELPLRIACRRQKALTTTGEALVVCRG